MQVINCIFFPKSFIRILPIDFPDKSLSILRISFEIKRNLRVYTMPENNNNDVVDQNPLPEKMKKTQFPEGLRVLAVDDDMTCLKTLAVMLQKCQYQVTETTKATEALDLLRKNKYNYDIVITDVRMPDMDGFELLRIIGLEMDVPVIMMSANDDTPNVMKGVMNGARDYLVKPVRMLELKNIWQHVMRKTILNPNKSSVMTKEDMENLPLKKRRDRSMEIEEENTRPDEGSVAAKKPRFAWTKELHKKFVDAVQQLDVERAVPKKILEILNEPQLTREIIASHLQKYRNFLKKQQGSLSEERTSNGDLNWTHGGVLNTTSTTSSDNKFLSVVGQANSSGEYSSSVDGFLSFRDQFLSKPDTNTSLLNEGLMILPLNQQNLLLQQNTHPSQMADQVRPPKTIPLLENVPSAPAWVTNPSRMMVDDYIDMPSQIPNFGGVQSGAPIGYTNFGTVQSGPPGFPGFIVRQPFPNNVPMAGLVSYPCPPGAFNIVRTPNHMLGNASTQFSPISQPNPLHGQHDGRSLTVFNGRTGLDFRGWSTGGHHAIDKSTVNGQGTHTQLLTDTIEIEDEINAAVKQFGKTSAPVL